MINGAREFAEVYFDDVVVPAERILGEVNGGWAVAMSILPFERSSCFWQRIAYLYRRLERGGRGRVRTTSATPRSPATPSCISTRSRARSRATQHRLADGATLGAETSIDKVLVATAEHATYDAIRKLLPGTVEIGRQRDRRRLARRVPLLARGNDLRRHRRSAAQHHRPPPARPRRRMMDAAERALLEETVGGALGDSGTTGRTGATAGDAALADVGWLEMLEAEPRDAVGIVFTALGASNRTATALDDVIVSALGLQPRADLAVLLPPFGTWAMPGRSRRRRGRRDSDSLRHAPRPPATCSWCARDHASADRIFGRSRSRRRRPTSAPSTGSIPTPDSTSRTSNRSPASTLRSTRCST